MQRGDAGLGDEAREVGGLLVSTGPCDNEARARHERPEELPDGDVEAEGRLLQDDVVRLQRVRGLHPQQAVHHGAMSIHGALGTAGGAGGEDDVGQTVGGGARWRSVSGLARNGLPLRVQAQHAGVMRGQAREQVLLGQQDGRARVLQHPGETLGGVGGVEGDVGAAGLERGKQGDDELQGALQQEANADLGPYALRDEGVRELIGPRVQLPVRQRAALELKCHRIRRALHLRLDEAMQRGIAREVGRRRVPVHQHSTLLGLLHERQRGHPLPGIHGDGLEQRTQVAQHARDGGLVEEGRAVLRDEAQAASLLGGDER
ncbi:hypothetical protein ASNO1_62760 [Corallococcus caeni]|uniref:Uncharacterized protein n=1 Tax=Corallococcus caeni TaxID=3082388 RepID=A0ABQ6R181_9BACT|nr:hypothetical protein ASNO1_62760 [Corallococcus sp. NO1]